MEIENLELKYNKYAENLKHVFSELHFLEVNFRETGKVKEIVDLARRYFEDAEYFRRNNQLVTALISMAYCEGLLDALRLLNYVNFKWLG